MAKRLSPGKSQPSPKESAAASDLEILYPHHTVTIRKRKVTAREYGFIEGLELTPTMKPFLDGLYNLISQDRAPPSFDAVLNVVATHARLVRRLVAQSITPYIDDEAEFGGKIAETEAWMRKLSDSEGDLLFLAWWRTNAGFFIRRVLRLVAAEKMAESQSIGVTSSTSSSKPTTDATSTTSAGG